MRVPLFIELSNRKVLVLGGGQVGTHRARKFSEAGARVVVVSKEFTDELKRLSREGRVVLYQVSLDRETTLSFVEAWIAWADIVVYTIPDVELAKIVRDLCKKYSKFLNDATDAEHTDIVVPFEGSINGIRIAVTTEGKSSTFARILRDWIVDQIRHNENLKRLAKAWFKAKSIIKREIKDPRMRMRIYRELMNNEEFLRVAQTGDIEMIEKIVRKIIEKRLREEQGY
ncbi:MAG: bifunctional precorrin-2 dehydrogenase/sirohydrochlorin ferrochelatase [Crenarchaeota archaeon]|nr:bifunctional precorrin-2 dehydrogenase/sirohydrochlorin ferrochelatase [Thermoproteota archaeon]